MLLQDILHIKYPAANFIWDIVIQNEAITQWNVPNTVQPTADQITAWQTDPTLTTTYTAQQNAITNAPIIAQLDIIDAKSIRALRTNDTARLIALEAEAVALRTQLVY